ncbi:hypothetical protein ACHAQA_006909 [Verticillium albo-atrum]
MADTGGAKQDIVLPQNSDEFHKIPWCRTLLTAPNTTVYVPPSRDPLEDNKPNRHDRFFAKTLDRPDSIPACVAFHATPAAGSRAPIPEVSVLFALGGGLAGYPGVLHGGVTALLMDELLGMLGQRNMDLERDDPIFTMMPATVTMDIRYLRPIPTPEIVLGVGTVQSITGRKMLLRGEIRDSAGNVLATCDSLWVAMAGKTKL